MNLKIIHKQNLFHNINVIKSMTRADLCAVVKGNAYGHGDIEIVELIKDKIKFFSVANDYEAIHLRKKFKNIKILILGNCDKIKNCIKNDISITIFSVEKLIECEEICKKLGKKCYIHLKVDTGMNRIGIFNLHDFNKCLKIFKKSSFLIFEGIFTHFSSLRSDDEYFIKQRAYFDKLISVIPKDFKPITHVGGSLVLLKCLDYDMIRAGIFIYGYNYENLRPVMNIYSQVISIKKVKSNAQIGYSSKFIAKKQMEIATLCLGYFDGFNRLFSGSEIENLYVICVCMDMIIVDNSRKYKIGEFVKVFSDAEQWQEYLNTNTHDVLVGFSNLRGKTVIID